MPIRKIMFHACALGVTLFSSVVVSANSSPWKGSYVANGQCFCAGSGGREIDSKIVPTPIGGQSVSQICERIGAGPALKMVDGKFNYWVYPDAQCGNGPFEASAETDQACLGHRGVAGENCAKKGPTWNLDDIYSAKAEPSIGISDSVVAGGSRYIDPKSMRASTSTDVVQATKNDGAADAIKPMVAKTKTAAKKAKKLPKKVRVAKARKETPEQLRARQEQQLAAARERAKLQEPETVSTQTVTTQVIEPAEKTEEVIAELPKKTATETEAVETVADAAKSSSNDESTPAVLSALQLPKLTRSSSREFDYVEGMPVNYDYGGAGLNVAASVSTNNIVRYLLDASVADTYREALLGVGFYVTPPNADRLTVLLSAGIEYGKFEFAEPGLKANLSSTGAFVGLSSRFVVNNKFELQGGLGYSSFFEGDAVVFGSAFYHLTRNFDLTSKAELGDNDSLGFGIRLYY